MPFARRAVLALGLGGFAAACAPRPIREKPAVAAGPSEINAMIAHYARVYDVPESLIHRVVQRESSYNPAARNGRYMGLMQIDPRTALTMGYDGPAEGLLDADTNLRYAVKYLRGAWLVSDGSQDAAVGWYSRGYYYEAKRRGLLEETGLRG
ncbi:MAG: transglycosylase SLT domain-containing protein [Paracoccaceae bacterium]